MKINDEIPYKTSGLGVPLDRPPIIFQNNLCDEYIIMLLLVEK